VTTYRQGNQNTPHTAVKYAQFLVSVFCFSLESY